MRLILILFIATMCASEGDDKADKALEAARKLAEEGKYNEALGKHVWYHEHALEICESHYGVRLSFALSDWCELGKKFPLALNKLKEVRDRKTALLLNGNGDREIFHDVESINGVLEEPDLTVKLFKHLDAVHPELAEDVSDLVIDVLASSKEHVLARKYLGDPMEELAWATQRYKEGMQWAQNQEGTHSRRAFEHLFEKRTILIISVLSASGEFGTARNIQAKALEVMSSELVEKALE
ncbi:hypothetical protein AAFN60_21265 [Roseibacillus persicicus]|uniref:hypothetical protein n=1 Tax=Roseibacillus persicicus TaxID=454148 RepID=UPI00398B48DB